MWRIIVALFSTGLVLGGCVAVPCAGDPSATCYAPAPAQPVAVAPGYPYTPGYPYAPPPDGLATEGYPVETIDGDPVALVFIPALGGWGYYDRSHQWRGAPPGVRERLEHAHPGGQGLPPPGPPGRGGPPNRPGPTAGPPPAHPGFAGPPPGRPGPPPGPAPGPVQQVASPPPPRRPPPPPRSCPPGQQHC